MPEGGTSVARPRSIAIIGAGGVGATLAYACLIRGVARRIVIHDVNRAKAEAESLDLNHGLQFVPAAIVEGTDDIEACRQADVVVVTAGAKQKPGQTRLDLAAANAEICRRIVPRLVDLAPEAHFLLVTNPVDVITQVTLALSGLPPARVIGSGTVLDSSRFRYLLAQRVKVAVQNVHATIVGEHGDSEIPLWSSATVGGIPLADWELPDGRRLTDEDRAELFANVRDAAYHVIKGKGATNYAVGLAGTRILEALFADENRILPVSGRVSAYPGLEGLDGVCLSLPRVVDRRGAGPALRVPMSDTERVGLRRSAETIQAAVRGLGF
jgi:L-lactate dehydrogenase